MRFTYVFSDISFPCKCINIRNTAITGHGEIFAFILSNIDVKKIGRDEIRRVTRQMVGMYSSMQIFY